MRAVPPGIYEGVFTARYWEDLGTRSGHAPALADQVDPKMGAFFREHIAFTLRVAAYLRECGR